MADNDKPRIEDLFGVAMSAEIKALAIGVELKVRSSVLAEVDRIVDLVKAERGNGNDAEVLVRMHARMLSVVFGAVSGAIDGAALGLAFSSSLLSAPADTALVPLRSAIDVNMRNAEQKVRRAHEAADAAEANNHKETV